MMASELVVLKGPWAQQDYTLLNGVNVDQIHFDPDQFIRWTGAMIEVFGDHHQTYEITFIDDEGCVDVHMLHVLVEKGSGIYLPNIFRPNSIAGNGVWKGTIGPGYEMEIFRVYDRWGNEVVRSDTSASWDGARKGKLCPSGVYVCQLIVRHAGTGIRQILTGDIILLR
jgi:gliding motility-associated-like protein